MCTFPQRPEEDIRLLGIGVKVDCNSFDMGAGH